MARKPTSTDIVSHRLKLQHLNVAMAVAQWGSMGKAAKQLAVSQPVVSKVIADLEHLLGVRLFDRSPQGVVPTLYCRALLKRSVAIFDDVRTSIEEIRFLADPIAGELRIGSTEPLLAGLVTATMERLWQKYPHIALRALQADSVTLLNRELPERRIELAVIPVMSLPLRDDLDATLLYRELLAYCGGSRQSMGAAQKDRTRGIGWRILVRDTVGNRHRVFANRCVSRRRA